MLTRREDRRGDLGLAAVPIGATVRITDVALASARRLRLAELGLRPHVSVTVLGRTAGNGRLLGVGTSRVAVDGRTCRLLSVGS